MKKNAQFLSHFVDRRKLPSLARKLACIFFSRITSLSHKKQHIPYNHFCTSHAHILRTSVCHTHSKGDFFLTSAQVTVAAVLRMRYIAIPVISNHYFPNRKSKQVRMTLFPYFAENGFLVVLARQVFDSSLCKGSSCLGKEVKAFERRSPRQTFLEKTMWKHS